MASIITAAETTRLARAPEWCRHLAVAFLVACFVFAIHAAGGFQQLSDARGDNDSLMRLVQVRDLLAGQPWFDLHQYRLGSEGGLPMHWSRLVDAPIAAIILAATALGAGAELSETVARILWPLLLFGLGLFAIMRIARMVGGEWAVLPATTLGAAALYFINQFRPGSLDHHNLQIVLVLAMVALLVDPARRAGVAALAGLAAAAMLAIGIEAAPYVAAAGGCVAARFLFLGPVESRQTAAFGFAFAGGTLAAFLATVGPAQWAEVHCDTLSAVHLALAAIAGTGLAAVALAPFANGSPPRRLAALAVLGAGFAVTAGLAFPQCLAEPYAEVDAEMRRYWIDRVSEVQSVLALAKNDWTKLLVYYVTPLLALGVHVARFAKPGRSGADMVYGAFLASALLVSFWQLRGSMFSIPLATIGLAVFVGGWRERLASQSSTSFSSLAMVAVWLLSFNVVWSLAGNALSRIGADAQSGQKVNCYPDSGFQRLAALPKGTVLAVTDLGAPILFNTPHSVVAGPYHRNLAGNRLMLQVMTGREETAEKVVRSSGVDYVVLCRGNPETRILSDAAPGGLLAQLLEGTPPDWLRADSGSDEGPIEIYHVGPIEIQQTCGAGLTG
jgi:hypothetical protein